MLHLRGKFPLFRGDVGSRGGRRVLLAFCARCFVLLCLEFDARSSDVVRQLLLFPCQPLFCLLLSAAFPALLLSRLLRKLPLPSLPLRLRGRLLQLPLVLGCLASPVRLRLPLCARLLLLKLRADFLFLPLEVRDLLVEMLCLCARLLTLCARPALC